MFVFDGFADWEPALAIASLEVYTDFSVHIFSIDGKAVRSMGNMQVQPEFAINEIDPAEVSLLILPGGNAWEGGGNEEVAPLVQQVVERNKNVAAICAATVFMARHGYLDNIKHTSNALQYLQHMVPGYKSERLYINQPSVSDGNIITANGAGMIEFAIEIFKKHQAMDNETIDKVFDLYKSGGMDNKLF